MKLNKKLRNPEANKSFYRVLQNIEKIVLFVLFSVMAFLAFANVITRYVFDYPLAFTEELEVGLMLWITLIGAAVGFERGAHLGISFFLKKFPLKGRLLLYRLGVLLTLSLFTLLIYFSYFQIVQEIELNITSEALGIPQWIYTLAIPVGSFLVILKVIRFLFKRDFDD